jgi:hypothetical protein
MSNQTFVNGIYNNSGGNSEEATEQWVIQNFVSFNGLSRYLTLYMPLSGTEILTGNIIPSITNLINLGSSSYEFSNIYTNNINVSSNATVGTLTATGSGTGLTITNNESINGSLTISTINSSSGAYAITTFSGISILNSFGSLSPYALLVNGENPNTYLGGNLTVEGDTLLNGGSTGLTVTNNESIGGNSSVAGNSSITGNETIGGTLTVTGHTTLNGSGTGLTVTNNESIGGNSSVTGNSSITGNEIIGGTLTVTGDVTLNGSGTGLTVTNNESIGGTLTVTGDVTLNGASTGLTVTNNESIGGTLTVTGDTTLNGSGTSLTVANDTAINGNLTVAYNITQSADGGTASLQRVLVYGDLAVQEDTVLDGTLAVDGLAVFGSTIEVGPDTSADTTATLKASASGSCTFTFPANNGTNNYLLQTDGSGNTSWTGDPSLNTITVSGQSNCQSILAHGDVICYTSLIQNNSSSNFEISAASTFYNTIAIQNATYPVTLKGSASATASTNFTFPPTNGTNNYLLQTDGSGNTSWTAPITPNVVSNVDASNYSITGSTSTLLSASITPSSSSSKILINVTGVIGASSGGKAYAFIMRNSSTNLANPEVGFISTTSAEVPANITYLDSPSSTSSTTYTLFFGALSGTAYWNPSSLLNTIVLQEIH